jgi:HSP20 family molecular chaperone IbpA
MKFIALISVLALLAVSHLAIAQPTGFVPGQGYGYAFPANRFSMQQGMRFKRYRDETGYQLMIYTRGMDPEAIQVAVRGRLLVVQNRESHRVERYGDRGSYRFAAASSNMKRRFPLPPDADAAAMRRSVEDGVVILTLPYIQVRRD